MSETTPVAPTIGRKLWLFISPENRRHDWLEVAVRDHNQALDASVAFVHPPSKHPDYTYVTITFADHDGRMHEGKVVPLRQPGQAQPNAREWVEWMPYQQSQAKKDAAQPPTLSIGYPPISRRDDMLNDLARGAADVIASVDESTAVQTAKNILAVVNTLHPQAVLTNPSTDQPRDPRDVASDRQGILIASPGARLAAATKATNGEAIEQEIQAKGLTAPRVSPADVQANIASAHCFVVSDAIQHPNAVHECGEAGWRLGGTQLLTICVLQLQNGFTVTGESACASPENFDPELGRKIARQNAEQKIWSLMGYELRSRLAAPAEPDFLAGSKACDLKSEGGCEACQ